MKFEQFENGNLWRRRDAIFNEFRHSQHNRYLFISADIPSSRQ